MAISPREFKWISLCEITKEAWKILKVIHKGSKTVKNSKLQMLTCNFEEIKMEDNETFDEFYAQLTKWHCQF
jgi:hypothetical protein